LLKVNFSVVGLLFSDHLPPAALRILAASLEFFY